MPGNFPNPKGRPKKKPTVLPDQSDSIPTAPETEAEELRRSTSARQRHQSLFRTHVALVTPDLDPLAHTRIVACDLVQDKRACERRPAVTQALSDKPESACEGCRCEAFKPPVDAIRPERLIGSA